ncbi:MAG: hypothetical protein A2756_02585 [Candidatus Ryanbacteria bacterium RIFCSPHIGHO2_01_FULL_48_27]|uniref:RNA polymerase sigma factor SigW n=1 Tax=Candidatus Ryanbacteria bacterium RIFCSPHIGHO2_01_FULL_48_27 TaxID=1802115 RepID=A0A1G2G784_9BACT|nr:MAG: hypothetical protein A2756_02585 [Candidatus Ryanbacteria bacterium RIFCSPHIGHO2_01_FULL_48_27]
MPEQTDEAIAMRVQEGDIESFGLLMDRYESKLMRYARKFLSDGEDIKDIVQDVCVKAYTNIQSFDADKRFSPWIYRIAHNELVNALKKKRRMPLFFFDLDVILPHPVAPETADGEANRQELRRVLDQYLGRIGPKYREPLVLYFFEEMEYKEIADILQIPISTVGVRIARGKAMLKKLLTQDDKVYV